MRIFLERSHPAPVFRRQSNSERSFPRNEAPLRSLAQRCEKKSRFTIDSQFSIRAFTRLERKAKVITFQRADNEAGIKGEGVAFMAPTATRKNSKRSISLANSAGDPNHAVSLRSSLFCNSVDRPSLLVEQSVRPIERRTRGVGTMTNRETTGAGSRGAQPPGSRPRGPAHLRRERRKVKEREKRGDDGGEERSRRRNGRESHSNKAHVPPLSLVASSHGHRSPALSRLGSVAPSAPTRTLVRGHLSTLRQSSVPFRARCSQ